MLRRMVTAIILIGIIYFPVSTVISTKAGLTKNVSADSVRSLKYYVADRVIDNSDFAQLSAWGINTAIVDFDVNGSPTDWGTIFTTAAQYNINIVIWPSDWNDPRPNCDWSAPFPVNASGDITKVKLLMDFASAYPNWIGIVNGHESFWSCTNMSFDEMAGLKTQLKAYAQSKGRDIKIWNYINSLYYESMFPSSQIARIMDVAVTWKHCAGGAEGSCDTGSDSALAQIKSDRARLSSLGLDGQVDLVYLMQTFTMSGYGTKFTLTELENYSCEFLNTNALDGFAYYTWEAGWWSDLSSWPELQPAIPYVKQSCNTVIVQPTNTVSAPTSTPVATQTKTTAPTATPTKTSTPTATKTKTVAPTTTPTKNSTSSITSTSASTAKAITITSTPTIAPTQASIAGFSDNFDTQAETWSHSAAVGTDNWGPSTAYSHSGTTSYYSSEPATVKDDYLLTRSIIVPANATLSFWQTYKMETGDDGGVIEISTNGGTSFTDLGNLITTGKYNGTISTKFSSPISGRSAWTGGTLGTWTNVVVDLSSYAGQTAIIRFRMTSDNGTAMLGWYIDDISITSSTTLVTATPTSTPTKNSTPSITSTSVSTGTAATMTSTPTKTLTQAVIIEFTDNFDTQKETWSHSAAVGTDNWGPSTAYSHSGTTSYYSSEPATVKDDYLYTRSILVPANAILSFWQTYKMETGDDGGVIEISTNGGTSFTDLGNLITTGKYNGTISTKFSSPISGRSAWTGGTLGTWTNVVVDLSSYAGQTAIIRFRMTSDIGTAKLGWYIDDVSVAGNETISIPNTGNENPNTLSKIFSKIWNTIITTFNKIFRK